MKRIFKRLSIIISGIIAFLGLLLWLISLGTFNQLIATKVSKTASQQLNGELTIETMNGNPLAQFSLNNILLKSDTSTLIQIDKLDLKYALRKMVHKEFDIAYLRFSGMHLFLSEDEDSLWNIEKLFIQNDSPGKDPAESSFPWKITLEELTLDSLEASLSPAEPSSLLPQKISSSASMKFALLDSLTYFKLDRFSLETRHPYLSVLEMKFEVSLIDSILNWSGFQLRLPSSLISSSGKLPLSHPEYAELKLQAQPLDFSDFEEWLPGIHGEAEIQAELVNNADSSHFFINLHQGAQKLSLNGNLSNMKELPDYWLRMEADSLNGEYWTHIADLKSTIHGQFELEGSGFDLKENRLSAHASFADLRYENYELTDLILSVTKNAGDIDGSLSASTFFGDIASKFQVESLFGKAVYHASLNLKHTDLAKITQNEKLASNLNMEIQADGQGFTPGELETRIRMKSLESQFLNQPVTDFNALVALTKDEYLVEGLHIETPYLLARFAGEGNFKSRNDFSFYIYAHDIEKTLDAFGLDPFVLNAELQGQISGPLDLLNIKSKINVRELALDSIYLKNAKGEFSLAIPLTEMLAKNTNSPADSSGIPRSLQNLNFSTELSAEALAYGSYAIDDFSIDLLKNAETVKGMFLSTTHWGFIQTQFNAGNIFSVPDYKLNITLKKLDLSGITQNEELASDLNLEIFAKGTGLDPKELMLDLEMRSKRSSIFDLPLEDFDSHIKYTKGRYIIEGLQLETPFASIRAAGAGDLYTNNKLAFDIQSKDISKIPPGLLPENLQLSGEVNGTISGPQDSLLLTALLDIDQFELDTISIEHLYAKASVQLDDSLYSGLLEIALDNSKIQSFYLKELAFKSQFTHEMASNTFSFFSSNSLNGSFSNEVFFSKDPTFYFPELTLNLYDGTWEGGSSTSFIKFRKDSIEINKFEISSDDASFKADGIFAFKGTENLQIELQNMNLMSIPGLQILPYKVAGIINANVKVSGTASHPVIQSKLMLSELTIDTIQFNTFGSVVDYSNEMLSFSAYLDDRISRLVSAELSIPMQLSFTDKILLPQKENPVNANVQVLNFDVSRLQPFLGLDDMDFSGNLSSQIKLSSTISNPSVNGFIDLSKAGFSYEKLGMDYHNITFSSKIENNMLLLDSLFLLAGKGYLKMDGTIESQAIDKALLKSANLNVHAQNFKAFDSEMLKAVLTSDLNVKGPVENPVFSGNLLVHQTMLNTDLFLKEFNRVTDDAEIPLLVQAQRDNEPIEINRTYLLDTASNATPDFYKNLKGQFDIEIPRNTWVKGKNMNFELAGNMKVVKSGEQIDLFGTMNVKRGFYKIYGRRMEFEEGQVVLTGGSKLNPMVDFKIAYKFRDTDKQQKTLYVLIKGKYSNPEVSFSMDNVAIEEKDAISYLLFNRSSNQLDMQQSSSLLNSNLDFAKDLAIGQFTNVVKDALQSTLGLDVIEITGTSGFTQGSVSVGKYINDKLFLNYERSFALDKKDKVIYPDKITLEYQFYRSLFLQATNQGDNSGFDFILKKNWK